MNKRVKHQLEIGLPLSELWKLYIEANAAPMVKNFCIVYIEMAFERAHQEVYIDYLGFEVSFEPLIYFKTTYDEIDIDSKCLCSRKRYIWHLIL